MSDLTTLELAALLIEMADKHGDRPVIMQGILGPDFVVERELNGTIYHSIERDF